MSTAGHAAVAAVVVVVMVLGAVGTVATVGTVMAIVMAARLVAPPAAPERQRTAAGAMLEA